MTTVGGPTVRTSERSRWVINVRDSFGRPRPLVLHVHDGHVFSLLDGVQTKQTPREVSAVRQALLEAQAEALQQRGSWE